MEIKETGFEGLLEIQLPKFKDERGYFMETFNINTFKKFGLPHAFLQDNQSFSLKGVLRGLHYQKPPYAQGKLVRVVVGRILDVVVDLRPELKTFGQHYKCILDAECGNMLYVPEGFAHGFITLEDAVFSYKCTNVYHKESENGIIWNDPNLNIDWEVKHPFVSEKDQCLPSFSTLLKQ